jgi:MraZ protein
MAVPVKYRQRLQDQCNGQMVVTMYQDPCLFLYPLPEWETVEKRLSDLSPLDDAAQAIRRLMIGHATECEMDSHGRLLLPPLQRELAELEKELVLIGQGERFEIWNERAWSDQRQVWRDKAARLDKTQLSPELKALKF